MSMEESRYQYEGPFTQASITRTKTSRMTTRTINRARPRIGRILRGAFQQPIEGVRFYCARFRSR